MIDANPPTLARMTKRFETEACSLLGVEEVPREQTGSYGIVSPADAGAEVTQVRAIVEKPAPEDREHETLGHELPNHARARGAKRGADRDLALAGGASRQQKIGDVRARDQQHERDRAQQRVAQREEPPRELRTRQPSLSKSRFRLTLDRETFF